MRQDPAVAATRTAVRRGLLAQPDLRAGDLVLAAVSGGADSLVLAAALAWVGPRLGFRAGAVTVDHQLQPEFADIAAGVVRTATELGLEPAVTTRAAVGTTGGPEAAARDARYAAIDAVAADHGATLVLLAHTLDDQAETVLLGLARGSGARSLAGMAARTGRYLRPFLALPRTTTRAACAASDLTPWDDPHNADPAYTRSRVRHHALPALEEALGPGVAAALARSADLLRDDADALDDWAKSAAEDLSVPALTALPAAVRRRVLRLAALAAGCPAGDLRSAHLAELDRLVSDWHGQGPVSLPGGLVVQRACDRLTFDDS